MNALSSPSVTAVICAAGKGERAKMNGNKLFAPLYGGVSAADKRVRLRKRRDGRRERMSGQYERTEKTARRARF